MSIYGFSHFEHRTTPILCQLFMFFVGLQDYLNAALCGPTAVFSYYSPGIDPVYSNRRFLSIVRSKNKHFSVWRRLCRRQFPLRMFSFDLRSTVQTRADHCRSEVLLHFYGRLLRLSFDRPIIN